jgi:hypothetical protein
MPRFNVDVSIRRLYQFHDNDAIEADDVHAAREKAVEAAVRLLYTYYRTPQEQRSEVVIEQCDPLPD